MMGRKNVLLPYHLVVAGDMSDDITSGVVNVQYLDNVGIQVVFTGDPVGTFTVEGSVDGTNYTELDLGTISASGAGDSFLMNMNQLPYPLIRLKYTATSGAGSLNAYVTAKTVGA